MRTPASTYRLQITEDFDLLDAARTLSYLHDLGVDWVYLSPVLAAESGSAHGYDVADHSSIDPSRGRASGLAAVTSEARRLGMGVLVDIVPNHVGVARPHENEWWWHVLTHGRSSPYAAAFDIDWDAAGDRLRIPVIGDDDQDEPGGPIRHLRVLAGELHYHDQRFPLAPGTASGDPDEDPNEVHARQHYELINWRRADHDLNYRRFFAVNTLAAVRVELPEWFEKTHEEIGRWFAEELVDGLRIDHPDGLRDPGKYLDDLAALTGGCYVLVEKILEPGEELPRGWATAGTTGYDALALVDRVLTDPAGAGPLTDVETRLRGGEVDWSELTHGTKRTVADTILNSEVRRIAREIAIALGEADSPTEPIASEVLDDTVAELLACFPVYRSYLPEGRGHLARALASARDHRPDLAAALDAVAPILGEAAAPAAQRFQQTSGMVMAKGVEDCAFYRYSRLTSLNEVGGDPSVFAISPAEFHTAMADRQTHWPHAMTASSTHDTKRGEDVRARIAVLAETPDRWQATVDRLLELAPVPDPGFGNLLWQAIIGTWPADVARLHGYAEKAMREAGDHTTWIAVDHPYENAVHAAVDALRDSPEVVATVEDLLARIADAGWSNALSAKLVALTMPGVPDVYQGSELWEQSLVDPDNRRPVDISARADLLKQIRYGDRPRLQGGLADPGAAKLLVTHVALTLRRERPELFTDYQPLPAQGARSDHALAFDRGGAITVATRLPWGLAESGGWADTRLPVPEGAWRDLVTGRRLEIGAHGVRLAYLLDTYPVALLVRVDRDVRGRFDVWAPTPDRVSLSVGDRVIPMERGADDWWTPIGPEPVGEVDYGYLIDNAETPVPDPRSRRQPLGVHARSRTVDIGSFKWTDESWLGRQLAGALIYELHVGTFSPEGTFDAAAAKLDHLVSLGVDFVELMPVNAVNGVHNWGYDGVLWSAVHEPYGGPRGYQRFVDACHAAGLGVIQDVVYNHLGPSGNYLPRFGPYLKPEQTIWGAVVNLDGEGSAEVRRLILDNVALWFEEFHVDALRLDAVHAMADDSPVHLLEEMAVEVAARSAHLRRPLTLIAESDLNEPVLITPREAGGYGLDAQWSDDFHHALHVALTRETGGYYADFEPLAALAKVCEQGFFHDGTFSSFRGREHGSPIDTDRMPGWRLVVCSQNHDQVGNRARGDRLTEHLDDDQLGCAALLTLTGPFTPMLFQGEEWAASTPFQFFTSHPEPELAAAVSQGRLKEFERMDWDRGDVPDPQDSATYERSRLDWGELERDRHAAMLASYRELIALRRGYRDLTDPDLRRTRCEYDEERRWLAMWRGQLVSVVNFGDSEVTVDLAEGWYDPVWTTAGGATVNRGSVTLPPHAGALLAPHRSG